jgi:hypothetical protein
MTGDISEYQTLPRTACQCTYASLKVKTVTSGDDDELTIDELARRIGMTVRNIRAHQSRGLLPPPVVRGRTGYLDLIRRLLEGAGGSSSEVLRFKHALAQPFGDDEPVRMGAAELIAEWGTADPALLQRSLELGVVRQLPDGRFELPSPRLARAARELVVFCVPP